MSTTKPKSRAVIPLQPVPAGEYAQWFGDTERSLKTGGQGADVPCGTCTACCRSRMFIHIRPEDKEALRAIPKQLLFSAPGLPKGHVLMGYNDKGACPMLVDGKCSIYAARPQTCRDYDCRIFTATGVAVDEALQAEIAERVKAWRFEYADDDSRQLHDAVRRTAQFLRERVDLFPRGSLPGNPVQMAVLAVKVHRLVAAGLGAQPAGGPADAEVAKAVLALLNQPPAAAAGGKGASPGPRPRPPAGPRKTGKR